KSRTRSGAIPQDLRERVKAAREARKTAKDAFHEARRRLREDPSLLALKEDAKIDARAAERHTRAASPLSRSGDLAGGWGTYCLAEDAAKDAATKPLYRDGAPWDPRFMRWSGEGRIGVLV